MKLLSNAIRYSYLILLFFTPLIFTSWNSELFEFPKMYFIFGFTIIVFALHLINYTLNNVPFLIKNKTNIFLGLFVLSQIISTFISVDPHTSIFGYYSRVNGGLISILAFSLLFIILPVYLDAAFLRQIINISILSGLVVAIYAIAQHFGIDNNKWVQDVQNRVFSSLGQPNWLAAYLGILLPLSLYKTISEYSKNHTKNIIYILINISFYISILYTKSKSGIIATLISLAIFFGFYFIQKIKNRNKKTKVSLLSKGETLSLAKGEGFLYFGFIIIFAILTLLIKNPLSEKIHAKLFPTPSFSTTTTSSTSNLLITPSQDIRKIVWTGTFELWKKYPFFGTGVETFGYSYYWTRPASHNLTSEWDFLYNKAHNEYLNYLSTTGIFGLISYLILISYFIIAIVKSNSNSLFKITLISSLINIYITNFAGFSVAIVSLYLFTLPQLTSFSQQKSNQNHPSNISQKIIIAIIIIFAIYFSRQNLNYYLADIAYSQADNADQQSDFDTAISFIDSAVLLHPNEPLYLIKSAGINAQLAVYYTSQKNQNAASQSIDRAIKDSQNAIQISPANTNHWKERAQVYYYLSTINPQYFKESINSLLTVTKLAPTDAKTFFLLGQFYEIASEPESTVKYYQKAIELKSNYDHAYFYLGKFYFQQKKYDLAKAEFEKTLQITPQYTAAQDYLDQIAKIKNQ